MITATVGRTAEMKRLLASLNSQTHCDFELIVVDQNPDDRIASILELYESRFSITRVCSERGLSRARNVGLRHVTGKVVGFPDDDCWYPPRFLESVTKFFESNSGIAGLTGRVVDQYGNNCARFDTSAGLLTKGNVWQRVSSSSMFFRSSLIERIGEFDEELGVGAGTVWGGAEDIDYPVRGVEAGFRIYYDPSLIVFHPNPLRHGYQHISPRAYAYGAGIGRVWRKHDYPARIVAYHLLRPLGGTLLSLATGRLDKARYHWSSLHGRLRGWRSRK